MDGAYAYVLEARLELKNGLDPAAVGAAVTVELCGHWEHEGPCRWPHNSEIDAEPRPAWFRTLFVCGDREATTVSERIEGALRGASAWDVLTLAQRPVTESERPLAERLLTARARLADPRRGAVRPPS